MHATCVYMYATGVFAVNLFSVFQSIILEKREINSQLVWAHAS